MLCHFIYSSFVSQSKDFDIYIHFVKVLETKEEEINKSRNRLIDIFANLLHDIGSQESNYLLENMIEQNLIESKIIKFFKYEIFIFFSSHFF